MRYFSLIISLFVTANGLAETDLQLDKITINSSKDELMTMNFQVFERSEFINRYENLASFLEQQNGMQVQQSGGLGNPALISIRGANSSQTQLLINGIAVNNSQYGSYDLNSIPINQIERIEISRSGSSFDLSDRAIGGTINIVTRVQGSGHTLSMRYRSESTYAFAMSSQPSQGLSVQYDHEQSANNYDYPVPSPYNDSQNQNQIRPLENAEFRRSSLQLIQQFESLTISGRYNQQDKNIPYYFRNNPDNSAQLSQEDFSLSATDNYQFNHQISNAKIMSDHQWQLYLNKVDERYQDPDGLIGLGMDNDDFNQYKVELQGQSKIEIKNWLFQSQLQGFEEGFASRHTDDTDSYECDTPQGSCDQLAYQKSLTILIAGKWIDLKKNHDISFDFYRKASNSYNRKRSTISSSNESNQIFYGYNFKYGYYFNQHEAQLSLKKSHKTPSLFQRYGDRGLLLGNEDLLAETSRTLAIDLLFRMSDQQQLTSSIFYRQLEDAIVPVYDSRGIGRYENSSQATLMGIESTWRLQGQYFYSQASLDFYDSLVTDEDIKSFDNKKIAGIYHSNIGLMAGYKLGPHDFKLTHKTSGLLYIDRSNIVNGEDHSIMAANYHYRHDSITIGGKVQNLTDSQYKDFTNRHAIGRQWLLFFNYSFK